MSVVYHFSFSSNLGERNSPGTASRTSPGALATVVGLALLLSSGPALNAAESLPGSAQSFIAKHCLECHSGDESKALVDLDVQSINWTATESTGFWERVYNVLSHQEMPPSDAPQPSDSERKQMVQWLEGQLVQHARPGGTVLRRLNREEYQNTIRDLCDLPEFSVPDAFPADDSDHGFDNIGHALILSPPLLAQYLELATSIADELLPPDTGPVVARSRQYDIGATGLAAHSASSVEGDRFRLTSSKSNAATAGWPARFEASESGVYRLSVAATTMQTDRMFYERIEGPFRLGVYAKPRTEKTYAPFEELRKLAQFELDPNRDLPQSFTAEFELNKGEAFGLRWENSPFDHNRSYSERIAKDRRAHAAMLQLGRDPRGMSPGDYYDQIVALMNSEKLDLKDPWLDRPLGRVGGQLGGGDSRKGRPQIRANWFLHEEMRRLGPALDVTGVSIEGPLRLVEDEQTRMQKSRTARFLGQRKEGETDRQFTVGVLRRFLPRAFRRPVSDEQVQAYADLVMREIDSKSSAGRIEDGLHLAVRHVLSSPNFLYRSVRPGELDDFDLASRLSYFLTSSPPDDRLFELAGRGELSNADVLRNETLRLLNSPRNTNFVRSFTGQWLGTRALDDIMPDPRLFFYHQSHQTAMTSEAEMLFAEILRENHRVDSFIDPGFSYRNKWTNGFYGENLEDKEMQRVEFPRGGRHGGIIGLAAVMMATANGVDTHPVQRGVWLLENVFGTPTPEPPDNVPAIPIDSGSATTMREKLEVHRADESCARCHDMIDPLGMVLENFDPIGRWREHYPIYVEQKGEKLETQFYSSTGKGTIPGPPIDSLGILKDGTRFEDVTDMKRYLLENIDIFARCLAGKLLVYATGRPMNFGDRHVIKQVVNDVRHDGNGFRDLIVALVLSDAFRSK